MKKILIIVAALGMAMSACAAPGQTMTASTTADSPLSGLGNLLGGNKEGGSGSGIGDALGGIVNGLLGTDQVKPERLVGRLSYTGPVVCFKSENFLQKAGGSAAAGVIEGKLEPTYKTLGLTKMVLVVNKDQTFTMTSGAIKMGGTVAVDGEDVYFNFSALGKIPIGKMKTYITLGAGGKTMSLMFDVTKLVSILKAVGGATHLSTVNTVTSLLDSYDGVCAGFKLKKQ